MTPISSRLRHASLIVVIVIRYHSSYYLSINAYVVALVILKPTQSTWLPNVLTIQFFQKENSSNLRQPLIRHSVERRTTIVYNWIV